jgi:hypothetical protein
LLYSAAGGGVLVTLGAAEFQVPVLIFFGKEPQKLVDEARPMGTD